MERVVTSARAPFPLPDILVFNSIDPTNYTADAPSNPRNFGAVGLQLAYIGYVGQVNGDSFVTFSATESDDGITYTPIAGTTEGPHGEDSTVYLVHFVNSKPWVKLVGAVTGEDSDLNFSVVLLQA